MNSITPFYTSVLPNRSQSPTQTNRAADAESNTTVGYSALNGDNIRTINEFVGPESRCEITSLRKDPQRDNKMDSPRKVIIRRALLYRFKYLLEDPSFDTVDPFNNAPHRLLKDYIKSEDPRIRSSDRYSILTQIKGEFFSRLSDTNLRIWSDLSDRNVRIWDDKEIVIAVLRRAIRGKCNSQIRLIFNRVSERLKNDFDIRNIDNEIRASVALEASTEHDNLDLMQGY